MSSMSPLFADRFLNLAVTGSLVRIELAAMTPPTKEGEKPELHPTQTLVMPLEGLVASMGMFDSLIKRLVADGILKVTPQSPPQPDPSLMIQ